jgi:superfamily II DNA helicase RecQ
VRKSRIGRRECPGFVECRWLCAASPQEAVRSRRWVDLGLNSYWAICVDYLSTGSGRAGSKVGSARGRIDYKEILAPEEFAAFSQLRQLRKEIAQVEAVPVYAVFTNEQLARFVQHRCRTKADLEKIEGVGEARIEKYAERILSLLTTLPEQVNAPDGKPV